MDPSDRKLVDEEGESQLDSRRQDYLKSVQTDIYYNSTFFSIGGITVGGLVFALGVVIFSYVKALTNSSGQDAVQVTATFVVFGLGFAFASTLFFGAFGLFSTFLFDVFNQSLGAPLSIPAQAANAGGFAGYFAFLPLVLGSPRNLMSPTEFMLAPCIAMLCGQIGAAYFAARSVRSHVIQHAKITDFKPHEIVQQIRGVRNWQFQLRDIVVLMVWVAVASTLFAGLVKFRVEIRFFCIWLGLTVPMSWFVAGWANQQYVNAPFDETEPPV